MPIRNARIFNTRLIWQIIAAISVVVVFVWVSRKPAGAIPSITLITDFTNSIGKAWWYYAAAIAAVSAVSVAFVEFLKAVLDLRRWYDHARLKSWLPTKAYEQLIFLAIGDWKSIDALCSQPTAVQCTYTGR
jgi:hypothetical protein